MHRRQRRRQVGVALVGHEHDGARLGDRHVRAGDADRGVDELLPQRFTRVLLDRLDGWRGAEDLRRVFLRQVDRRRDQVRRMRVRELHHPLAEVGLDDLHAETLEVVVDADLLARH